MEKPIKQNVKVVWKLILLCLFPLGFCAVLCAVVLYIHGQKDPTQFFRDLLKWSVAFVPLLLAVLLAGMRPAVKWFITDVGLKRVIRGNVLIISWQQIYHMANTDHGFFVRWRDPKEPGVVPEDLEHRAHFYPDKADADELIALWEKNIPHEARIKGQAHFKARNRRVSKQMLVVSGVMMVGGAVLIAWGAWDIVRQYPSTRWPSVDGKVISEFYRPIQAGGSYKYRSGEVTLPYEYVVDDQIYRSGRFSLAHEKFRDVEKAAQEFAEEHQRGAVVKVYYNPKHPEQSVLLTGPSWRDDFALMLLGGFLVLAGFLTRMIDKIARRGQKMRKQ